MNWIDFFLGKDKEIRSKSLPIFVVALLINLLLLVSFFTRTTDSGDVVALSFYAYLFLLSGSAVVLVKKHILSSSLIVLASVELLFGIGFSTIGKLGIPLGIRKFAPTQENSSGGRCMFHPLLAAVPRPNRLGFNYSHNAVGLRNNRLPFDPDKSHIAVFGGSTTYDIGVEHDRYTWVSHLDESMDSFTVSNNGVPGYSTAEHLVQTAFYADRAGKWPVCAVYYIGWNDIRNFGFSVLDPGYATFHLPSQYGNLRVRFDPNTPSAIANVILSYFGRNELPFPVAKKGTTKSIQADDPLFEFSKRNLQAIVTLNQSRNIKTLFIGQILNRDKFKNPKQREHSWMPFVADSEVWRLQVRFNKHVRDVVTGAGSDYFMPDVEDFDDSDFVDNGHFSNRGAQKFASVIEAAVLRACGAHRGREKETKPHSQKQSSSP